MRLPVVVLRIGLHPLVSSLSALWKRIYLVGGAWKRSPARHHPELEKVPRIAARHNLTFLCFTTAYGVYLNRRHVRLVLTQTVHPEPHAEPEKRPREQCGMVAPPQANSKSALPFAVAVNEPARARAAAEADVSLAC